MCAVTMRTGGGNPFNAHAHHSQRVGQRRLKKCRRPGTLTDGRTGVDKSFTQFPEDIRGDMNGKIEEEKKAQYIGMSPFVNIKMSLRCRRFMGGSWLATTTLKLASDSA